MNEHYHRLQIQLMSEILHYFNRAIILPEHRDTEESKGHLIVRLMQMKCAVQEKPFEIREHLNVSTDSPVDTFHYRSDDKQ